MKEWSPLALPPEIWFSIASVSATLDFISLMLTSTHLYHLLRNDAVVWKEKVYDLISEERPAPYSIQPELMSLDELRACATRPFRLRAALRHPEHLNLELYKTSILTSAAAAAPQKRPNVHVFALDPHLLPGGRWLLDLIIDRSPGPGLVTVTLVCWDTRADSDGECYPVAELLSGMDHVSEWFQQATDDPMKVNILLSGTDSHGEGLLEMIQLVWSFDTDIPRLCPVASAGYPAVEEGLSSMRPAQLYGNLVAFTSNDFGQCLIWDWVTNLWAKITTPIVGREAPENWNHVDFWLQPPYIFFVSQDSRILTCHHIPPFGTFDVPATRANTQVAIWFLPVLPRDYVQTLQRGYNTDNPIRYHKVAHPGYWKPSSLDPCLTAVSLYTPDLQHYEHRLPGSADYGENGEGGALYFLDTRAVSLSPLSARDHPPVVLPPPSTASEPVALPPYSVRLRLFGFDDADDNSDAFGWNSSADGPETILNASPSSRLHWLGTGLNPSLSPRSRSHSSTTLHKRAISLLSLHTTLIIDQSTSAIYLSYRLYELDADSQLLDWPIEHTLRTPISYLATDQYGRTWPSSGKRRLKSTDAPCLMSGMIMASERLNGTTKMSFRTATRDFGPSGVNEGTFRIWLMRFE